MMSRREIAELLPTIVEGKSDIVFADLFAEDGVMEFPFVLPGFWPKLEGQRAIREFYEHAREVRKLFDMQGVSSVIHETDDPEVVIVEIKHHGHSHVTNRSYEVEALGVIRVRDGKIVHYRDYMNPLAMAELLDRVPDLVSALSAA
jgi:uncharacterized protein